MRGNSQPARASSLRVRRARHSDLDGVAVLFDQYRQFYGQRADLERARTFIVERIRRRQSAILVAVDAPAPGSALGFVQLYPSFSSVSTERAWILNDLFVAPDARRQGVATLLMDAARQFAKRTRAVWIELATWRDNDDARRLYEALGYHEDRAFVTYRLTP